MTACENVCERQCLQRNLVTSANDKSAEKTLKIPKLPSSSEPETVTTIPLHPWPWANLLNMRPANLVSQASSKPSTVSKHRGEASEQRQNPTSPKQSYESMQYRASSPARRRWQGDRRLSAARGAAIWHTGVCYSSFETRPSILVNA